MKVRSFFQYETQFVGARRLVSYLCVLCALVVNSAAQDFKTIHDGVEHATVNYKLGSDPVKINLLRLDLKKVRLDVHHAMDAAIGTERTSSIATRHGAIAAINAGFFRLDTSIWAGESSGFLKIDGSIFSESVNDRVALLLANGSDATEATLTRLSVRTTVRSGKTEWKVWGVNRELDDKDLVVFTPGFHPTTLTKSAVVEVVVSKGRVARTASEESSSIIPADGFVIASTGGYRKDLAGLKLGAKVSISSFPEIGSLNGSDYAVTLARYLRSEDVVSGRPQLMKGGKVDITWEQERVSKDFVEMRHPRTAVALMKDGKFLMITVDGRQPGVSVGMNLYELADYLLSLGAHDAMNLDGGGSTTMFLDGKVVNTPSDKEGERKVGDAILVTLRKNK